MKIILDTNILVYAVRFKIDLFEQLRGNKLFTLNIVKDELKKLSSRKGKTAMSAKIALMLTKDLKILLTKGKADTALLKYAKKGYVIATQDRELINKLRKAKCKVIFIRQKKYFEGV